MKKIAIIEDDLIVSNTYRNKLAVEGYKVETAYDGDAAWDLLQNSKPDAVLLDLNLPKLPGIQLLQKIRASPEFRDVPVIVLSNTYLSSMVQEAWKAGASKVLSKANCTPREVLMILRSCLGSPPAKPANAEMAPRISPPGTSCTVAGTQSSIPRSDEEFQEQIRKDFMASTPSVLGSLRTVLQGITRAQNEETRIEGLAALHRKMRSFASGAGVSGLSQLGQMAAAAEALLKELHKAPKNLNPSTLRTIASSIDAMGLLSEQEQEGGPGSAPTAVVLVVDDEPISRMAIRRALDKANLNCISVDSPVIALSLLKENRFDLVFLDVDMPEINGFELCEQLRKLPAHQKTPVVFVTGLNDFENRAQSMISGGTDLIGKPFLPIELALKALGYVMRGRMRSPVKKLSAVTSSEPVSAA